jgi:hypothetical protein
MALPPPNLPRPPIPGQSAPNAPLLAQIGQLNTRILDLQQRLEDLERFFVIDGSGVTLRTGMASIKLTPNGDITLEGKDIRIRGSGDVQLRGSRISQN